MILLSYDLGFCDTVMVVIFARLCMPSLLLDRWVTRNIDTRHGGYADISQLPLRVSQCMQYAVYII